LRRNRLSGGCGWISSCGCNYARQWIRRPDLNDHVEIEQRYKHKVQRDAYDAAESHIAFSERGLFSVRRCDSIRHERSFQATLALAIILNDDGVSIGFNYANIYKIALDLIGKNLTIQITPAYRRTGRACYKLRMPNYHQSLELTHFSMDTKLPHQFAL
jgi:hypothetical protein